jgi:ABC-type lipoprotein export system ATPase subunit
MKIEYLEIKNYKQFTNLKLELTYPLGHGKEGQPLDKICIIGQSGTGKTNLLEIIRDKKNSDSVERVFIKEKSSSFEKIYFYGVQYHIDNSVWDRLKTRIDNYGREKQAYKSKLFNKVMNNPNYIEQSIRDIKEWEKKNENILEKMSDNINSIIKKFNLELKIDEDTKSYVELIIKDLSNGNIISYDNVSSGTKNLLSTFIPLKSYSPKDSIILIDEPENSFYPDIQRELTDLYMSVGENNQLIMATHSPLIASSFEPWEVVELKFDKNNQIYREQYYEGENHVDNYTLDPRVLTWTGILTDIFDLKEDSNFSFREKRLMEYAMLKTEIKSTTDIAKKEGLFNRLQKISKQLGFYNQ